MMGKNQQKIKLWSFILKKPRALHKSLVTAAFIVLPFYFMQVYSSHNTVGRQDHFAKYLAFYKKT